MSTFREARLFVNGVDVGPVSDIVINPSGRDTSGSAGGTFGEGPSVTEINVTEMVPVGCGERMRRALTKKRMPAATEAALQEAIALAFDEAGIAYEREVCLTEKDRIDFVVEGSLGLEVKIGGGLSDLTRQLHRYAQSPRLAALVLVTTRMQHLAVVREFNAKRIDVVHLIGGSL